MSTEQLLTSFVKGTENRVTAKAILWAGAFGIAVVVCGNGTARGQAAFGDAAAMTQFQRKVDAYAFEHRQVQRRLGGKVDQQAMAAGMRAARPSAAAGDFFEPVIAATLRNRIAGALKADGCKIASPGGVNAGVPGVGTRPAGTQPLPRCLLSVLPNLPEELEYRLAGVGLILLDTHANTVVDVLHNAFPPQQDR